MITRTLQELADMQQYLDPERQEITLETMEKRRLATRKKVSTVMEFLKGSK